MSATAVRRALLPTLALVLLAAWATACRRPQKTTAPSQREQMERALEKPKAPLENQIDPNLGTLFEVRDHTWLCKRETDVFLTNRERTEKDRDFFDSRISQGLIVELPGGTRVRRVPGNARRLKMLDGRKRLYVRCEVLDDAFKDSRGDPHRGLIALDTLVPVSR